MNRILEAMTMSKVINAREDFPKQLTKSIFLAGPVPRDLDTPSWRPYAISYLQNKGYNGIIYNPETSSADYTDYYEEQFTWEHNALDKSDIILFWIPRKMANKIYGLTTNIEFGLYANSHKIIVAAPEEADDVEYIKQCCLERNIPFFTTLEDALNLALELLPNNLRKDNEIDIPAFIWNNNEFQSWYQSQINVGNKLLEAKVHYSYIVPHSQNLFMWVIYAKMWIEAEQRIKDNELILSRTDLVSVLLHYQDQIILVKEYRSVCNNSECYVYELPGGSSPNCIPAHETAMNEVKEEIGVEIPVERFKLINIRQAVATFSAHHIYAYKVELTKEEFNRIIKLNNTVHGLHNEGEYTYLQIKSINDIIKNNLVDWTNLGIILSALYKG